MESRSDAALRIVLNVRETSTLQSLQRENAHLKEKITDPMRIEVQFLQETMIRFARHCLFEVNNMLNGPPDTYELMKTLIWKGECSNQTYKVVCDKHSAHIFFSEEYHFDVHIYSAFKYSLNDYPGLSDSIMKICFNGHREYKLNHPEPGDLLIVTDTYEGHGGEIWHNDNYSWS